MTTLREAAQQALDFCEFLWREVAMNDYAEEQREATEAALRAALAEQDDDLTAQRDALLEALKEIVAAADGKGWEQIDPSFKKARAAIAKAEGEKR